MCKMGQKLDFVPVRDNYIYYVYILLSLSLTGQWGKSLCEAHAQQRLPLSLTKENFPENIIYKKWEMRRKEKQKMRTEFFMAMKPPTVTHQEKKVAVKNGKPVFYEPQELKDARNKLESHLNKHKPDTPYTSGVRLLTKWCFPRGNHKDGEYRVTKPDTDNLQKLLKDCMTSTGFWEDDALVASEITEKFWADIPGIYIAIEEL